MWAVSMRVWAALRHDWRGPVTLTLITGLLGGLALVAFAGARRTDTAVARFAQYAGPTEGEVDASPTITDKIAALPGISYTVRGALLFAFPAATPGRPAPVPGQVTTWALVTDPPEERAIIVAGRRAMPSRASEAMINESAARIMGAHLGTVIRLQGVRPDQVQQVLDSATVRPSVRLPAVRVVGIIRTPVNLTENLDAPTNVSFIGTGSIYVTSAFYHRVEASVGKYAGLDFHLKRGNAGLAAFQAEVKRRFGSQAQVLTGSDAATAAAAAQRGTSLQAFALAAFGGIVMLALLVIVAQNMARLAWTSSDDFPALRALGASRRQLTAVAIAPGALAAVGGAILAVPVGYGLSAFTPIGLARRAEISPGLSFDAPILLGGAAVLALLLTARAAITAVRVARLRTTSPAAETPGWGSRAAGGLARQGFPPSAVSGVRLAFEPGRGAAAVPVRSAVLGMTVALAAVMAALVFGSSLDNVISNPVIAGWNWTVAVGNPHAGDTSAQMEPRLRADPDVSGFTATAMGGGQLDGQPVTVVGLRTVRGQVTPPVLAGRLPRTADEIALSGRDLQALHKRIGDVVTARTAHRPVALHIVGQVVLSPEITNEQVPLGRGGVMTLAGLNKVNGAPPPPVNVFLVRLRPGAGPAALTHLERQFPGVVLPALAPPEVRNLAGVNGLPLTLALLLALLAIGTVAHTLITSVRRRRRDLAILKAFGFVGRQVQATVAWQATAIAGCSLIAGAAARPGRWPVAVDGVRRAVRD